MGLLLSLPEHECGHIQEVREYLRKIGVTLTIPGRVTVALWTCVQCQVQTPATIHLGPLGTATTEDVAATQRAEQEALNASRR